MTTSNPRRAAFDILVRIERDKSYADILIDRTLSLGALQGPDRGLLTELVYGICRRQGTLDYIINLFANQPTDRLERSVHILLRLGLYQALFLDRIPISAAVNETVKIAKEVAPRAAGFINAVLRSADRGRQAISYPDRATDPAGFMATYYSHPRWMVEEWIDQLGMEETEALAQAMAKAPPLTIRVNTLKISREGLRERLATEGVATEPADYSPVALHIVSPLNIAQLASFQEGLFTVQDESSQLAAQLLGPLPGEQVLDACAAPGGKTTHLAQLMTNSGRITACDVEAKKLRFIAESSARLGINIVETLTLDASQPRQALGERSFDRILIDAPCSGLGVIRRNPEGKWWKSVYDVARLAALQKTILSGLAASLNNGGTLLYSTCSTTQAENEAVVNDFLSRHPDFVVEDLRIMFPEYTEFFTERGFFRSWPHRHGMDGFFAARLRKN